MLARFAFAAVATAVLVVPVAAEPSTSTAARSKEQVKIEVKFITVAEDFVDLISKCPGGAEQGAAIGAGATAGVDVAQKKKAQQYDQAAAAAVARAPSLDDIVSMTQKAVPTPKIVEKIRSSGVVYRLTADQIIWLNRQGVAAQVVEALQDTVLRPAHPVYTAPTELMFLDDKELHQFLESLQGDVRTNFEDAIKAVVSNGKTAVWHRTRQHPCGNTSSESHSSGYKVSIRPKIVADRAVALKMKLSLTNPDTEKLSLTDEFTIPAGRTVVLGGWKRVSEGRNEYGPPVVSKIPYANRLFRKVGYQRVTETILVLVTATIVDPENK